MTEAARAPGLADIDRIVALPDPVVRNLWITQTYAQLSATFARRTGEGANWCTFATWASKQAGQTIRSEDLERVIERELGATGAYTDAVSAVAIATRALGVDRALGDARATVREVVDVHAIAGRAAAAVARGNLRVFDEIARLFAAHEALSEREFAVVLAALPEGEPPTGQTLLRKAFSHYGQALATTGSAERSELLVLANLEIGLHEQIRLQPDIAEALNAAVPGAAEIRHRLLSRMNPRLLPLLRARLAFWRMLGRPAPLDRALEALVDALRFAVRHVITSHLMTMALPGQLLRLGADVGSAPATRLERPSNAELAALIERIDPRPDDGRDSGALDWADVRERMHFIAELFRRFHAAQSLHAAPFTDAQLEMLRAGRKPDGPL